MCCKIRFTRSYNASSVTLTLPVILTARSQIESYRDLQVHYSQSCANCHTEQAEEQVDSVHAQLHAPVWTKRLSALTAMVAMISNRSVAANILRSPVRCRQRCAANVMRGFSRSMPTASTEKHC